MRRQEVSELDAAGRRCSNQPGRTPARAMGGGVKSLRHEPPALVCERSPSCARDTHLAIRQSTEGILDQ